jgi:thiol-disulfide isomerase/thioredoxin
VNPSATLRILGIGLFAVASLWIHHQIKVVMAQGQADDRLGDLVVGSLAPDFTATDLHGEAVSLSQSQGSRIVVLDFWASWCGPCLMAMPSLQAVHDEFGDGVEILAVNVGETPDRAASFVERKGYTFRVVEDQSGDVAKLYNVQGLPTQVVVGRDGVIEHIRVGFNPAKDDLRDVVVGLTQ